MNYPTINHYEYPNYFYPSAESSQLKMPTFPFTNQSSSCSVAPSADRHRIPGKFSVDYTGFYAKSQAHPTTVFPPSTSYTNHYDRHRVKHPIMPSQIPPGLGSSRTSSSHHYQMTVSYNFEQVFLI